MERRTKTTYVESLIFGPRPVFGPFAPGQPLCVRPSGPGLPLRVLPPGHRFSL